VVNGVATDTIVRDASQVPLPKLDAAGKPVPYHVSYPTRDAGGVFLTHPNGWSVIKPHNLNWVFIQATVAILILVGFESVTAMSGEAKNAKRDVPIAVIVSLLVQGVISVISLNTLPPIISSIAATRCRMPELLRLPWET
jgi:APA family basic amino acid/polyamine antiporter